MHEEKGLDQYIRERVHFKQRLEQGATPTRFSVRGVNPPDTFHLLKYDIMAYLEDRGYRCAREKPFFEPSERKLYFKCGNDKKVALIVHIAHKPYAKSEGWGDLGTAQVVVKQRYFK